MTRTRTTPKTRPSIALHTVERWCVVMSYNPDGSVNKPGIVFEYVINNRDAAGNITGSVVESVSFTQWPAGIKANMKSDYTKVLNHATAKGLIGAGTDTNDLA